MWRIGLGAKVVNFGQEFYLSERFHYSVAGPHAVRSY